MQITSSDWQRLNPQSIKPVGAYKKDRVSQGSRLRPGIIQKQHHEIKQCVFRVRPTDNARFEIDGLQVDQKINYQEWSGESLSAERRADYEIYPSTSERNGTFNSAFTIWQVIREVEWREG